MDTTNAQERHTQPFTLETLRQSVEEIQPLPPLPTERDYLKGLGFSDAVLDHAGAFCVRSAARAAMCAVVDLIRPGDPVDPHLPALLELVAKHLGYQVVYGDSGAFWIISRSVPPIRLRVLTEDKEGA